MGKIALKTLCFCLFACLISINTTPAHANPTTLGDIVVVDGYGHDPDIAIDSEGALHIAYVRAGSTYYRKVTAPYTDPKNIGKIFFVGKGANPQIAVDSKNNPHVVHGRAYYSYWNGSSFSDAGQAFSAWRKNLIAIDSQDRVYIVADKFYPRSVLVRVYKNGKGLPQVGGKTTKTLANDNPGGISIDAEDKLHITWRDKSNGYSYYRNYLYETAATEDTKKLPNKTGDFSWCAVDHESGKVHIVYTAAHASGLFSSIRDNGKWTNSPRWAIGLGDTGEPDNVNPTNAADAEGNVYVTFRGRAANGYYLVFDSDGNVYNSNGSPVAPSGATDTITRLIGKFPNIGAVRYGHPGSKLTNANVATHPEMTGAFVAWGERMVRVRSIGDISFNGSGTAVSSVIYDILLTPAKKKEDKSLEAETK